MPAKNQKTIKKTTKIHKKSPTKTTKTIKPTKSSRIAKKPRITINRFKKQSLSTTPAPILPIALTIFAFVALASLIIPLLVE